MWKNEHIYSIGDTVQFKSLAEFGINAEDYKIDETFANAVDEKAEEIQARIKHIDSMMKRLNAERNLLQEILDGKLHRMAARLNERLDDGE